MSKQICMKFSGKTGNAPMNKWLNFGGDPDQDLDSYHDTGKRWLGGDMHCPSASSYGRPMGRPLYFHPVVSSFFLSSFLPRLISAITDWMSAILPHVVWP